MRTVTLPGTSLPVEPQDALGEGIHYPVGSPRPSFPDVTVRSAAAFLTRGADPTVMLVLARRGAAGRLSTLKEF